MTHTTKSKQLAIGVAKVIRVNGDIEYHYSLPKVSIFNIKGMVWLWRRLKEYKAERKTNNERITKISYHN